MSGLGLNTWAWKEPMLVMYYICFTYKITIPNHSRRTHCRRSCLEQPWICALRFLYFLSISPSTCSTFRCLLSDLIRCELAVCYSSKEKFVKSWPVPMYGSRPSELDSEDTVTTSTSNSSLTVTYLVLWPSRGCSWVPFVIGCLDFNWRQDRHRPVVSSTNERTWTCQSVRWRGSM